MRLEVRSDERTVDVLAENRFAVKRASLDLECVARRVGAKRGVGHKREMLNVDDWPARRAPGGEQIGNPLFRIRVIPRSPARIVEALLYVDEEKGGAG